MSRCTARRPTLRVRTRRIRWALSVRWPPCWNTVSGLTEEAAAVNRAMETVLNSGKVTADLKPAGQARHHGGSGRSGLRRSRKGCLSLGCMRDLKRLEFRGIALRHLLHVGVPAVTGTA